MEVVVTDQVLRWCRRDHCDVPTPSVCSDLGSSDDWKHTFEEYTGPFEFV
jgi:hypothetical protein